MNEPFDDILSPVGKVNDHILKGLKGQTFHLLIHMVSKSGQKID